MNISIIKTLGMIDTYIPYYMHIFLEIIYLKLDLIINHIMNNVNWTGKKQKKTIHQSLGAIG